jgi:predicted transglutaminase-like cysteine proteinase
MRTTCSPRTIIAPPRGRADVRYQNGDTRDIITVILDADADSDQSVNRDAVECLRGATDYDTLRNVWKFVRSNNTYRADRPGHERVKSPAALYADGHGDCKSYSIAEVALLRALGFKGIRYRFAAYSAGDFTHVYVVCRSMGRDVILDAVHTRFDDEVRYTRKRDYQAATSTAVSGLPAPVHVSGTISNIMVLGGLALAFWAFTAYNK